MSEEKTVYLSRENKVFGPYSLTEVDRLKTTGEYIKFFWFWDGSTDDWVPANPPPPLPVGAAQPAKQPAKGLAKELERHVERSDRAPFANAGVFRVICHDFRDLVSGTLVEISQKSCLLLTPAPHSGLPTIRKGRKVWLSMLNESSNQSENIEGTVSDTRRRQTGEWEYVIEWSRIPELLIKKSE